MASWSETTKHTPSKINGGNRYEAKDRVSREQLNAITENSFYAVNQSEDAKTESASALNKATEALNKINENISALATLLDSINGEVV